MSQEQYISLARTFAKNHGLDIPLVCALIEQESDWDTWEIRYEPGFQRRYVDALNLQPTETVARSISWGLMQIMGQVAREEGFTGALASLCDPLNGLEYGCKKLARCLGESAGDWTGALLRYNGGNNEAYPELVLSKVEKYKENVTT